VHPISQAKKQGSFALEFAESKFYATACLIRRLRAGHSRTKGTCVSAARGVLIEVRSFQSEEEEKGM
jgi:hypothetical protein